MDMSTHHTSASTDLYKEVYGSGDPILCLHGLGANIFSWRHLITPLSQKHQLILVDFKGSGKSPKPHDQRYSIDDKADDIYKLIIAENMTNLTLVGNSLGGAVALLLAIRLTQEDPVRLSKLILIDSAGDKNYVPWHFKVVRSILGAPITYLTPSKLVTSMSLRACYYEKKKTTSEQIQAYATPIASPGGRHALLQTVRHCIPPNADDIIAKLPTITVPTLILWGRQDQIIPLRVGQSLHQLIPNSTLEIIEECGHVPQEEKPAETVAIISRFLAGSS
ncbi:MAG TPA: alpha/beta hydrolase [Pyrinomonadaceae bacterium]|nr:alpha/beta hydrolase [Pyrinomonadaceae bacterium]